MATRKTIGLRGEQEAVRYLRKRGYKIIAHRDRILRGDIDIVALDKRAVVFVEVRSKTSAEHGHPARRGRRHGRGRVQALPARGCGPRRF